METALALPDETKFREDIATINRFQQIVHSNMIQGQDYGVIPGTQKPTLLKPGAEKITKLLGLADSYEIVDRQEDWDKPFFRYLVKCKLTHINSGSEVSEGLGECNSKESKYRYRWVFPSELPEDFDKDRATFKLINTRNGKARVYRVDNDDIFTQVNTLVKMAKKRSLVDAALSAGRLSNVFTQDIEDTRDELKVEPTQESKEPEPKLKPEESPEAETSAPIDMAWLKESLKELNWADVSTWLRKKYPEAKGTSIKLIVESLTREHQEEFVKEVQKRLETASSDEGLFRK